MTNNQTTCEEYGEEDYLMLSGLQHFLFCRRQWALIHIENQWQDNLLTTEGNIMHERVHDENLSEFRNNRLIIRGMRVSSRFLGISGQCDVVEFHKAEEGIELNGRSGKWKVFPIEYKRGNPKKEKIDEAQLCAEAMCLEEMLGTDIDEGSLYYGQTRHRIVVQFTKSLRKDVSESYKEMHQYYSRGYTPKVKTGKWCKSCSLINLCMPELMNSKSAKEYIKEMLCENS